MSKRKYAKDVTRIIYSQEYKDGEISHYIETNKYEDCIPVRVVRESFYRKLIKALETPRYYRY